MFNRQPFNRGKFNSGGGEKRKPTGISIMTMNTSVVKATRTVSMSGASYMAMRGSAKGTLVKYNMGASHMGMSGDGIGTKVFVANPDSADMAMATRGEHTVTGEEAINLNGLVLKPNDELVINTCDMTVTLNGQNAMQYFSSDSAFISLLNGENSIEYNDTSPSRKIAFDVIWKDRWL